MNEPKKLESLEGLESRINVVNNLKNRHVVQVGDQTFVYLGQMYGLEFDSSMNIKGHARIGRYAREQVIDRGPIKSISIFPFKIEREPTTSDKDVKIWEFATEDIYGRDSFGWNLGRKYLINSGKPQTGYKEALRSVAIQGGIILSDEVLNTVFSPIENFLIKHQEEARMFSRY